MTKLLVAGAAMFVVLVALDLLWLGLIAKPLYQQGIGHLMAEQPRVAVAAVFYAVFTIGLLVFVVDPTAGAAWPVTVARAALFGLVAYATYDLSNLATLKSWPVGLSLINMAWGSALSAAAASAGKWVSTRF